MTSSNMRSEHKCLTLAAKLTGVAALLHLGCIIFGASWYRFLGAGEQMALLAEQGHWYPTVVTSVITLVLLIWTLYALSGAKVIRPLPFLRVVLAIIAAIFLLRGLGFYWLMPAFPDNSLLFWLISSGICIVLGGLYAFGGWQIRGQNAHH